MGTPGRKLSPRSCPPPLRKTSDVCERAWVAPFSDTAVLLTEVNGGNDANKVKYAECAGVWCQPHVVAECFCRNACKDQGGSDVRHDGGGFPHRSGAA